MTKIEDVKEYISSVLPDKVLQAFCAYDTFSTRLSSDDIKEFGSYHGACKNALAHIVALLRLSEIVQAHTEDVSAQDWLIKAQRSLQQEMDYDL